MIDVSVERTALLALSLHEMTTNESSVGGRIDGDEISDDLEAGWGSLSLLTMIASRNLSEFDWDIVNALAEGTASPEELAPIFAEADPLRAESILHVLAAGEQWGGGKRLPNAALSADLALLFAERWVAVEDAMERWRSLGITTSRDDVRNLYLGAMEAGTGESSDEILAAWYEDTPADEVESRLETPSQLR